LRTSNRKAEGGRRKSEVGSRKSEAGSRKSEAGKTLKALPDLMRRLAGAQDEVAIELVRRGAFEARPLEQLLSVLLKNGSRAPLRAALCSWIDGRPVDPRVGFIPALANADRQLAIHAVVNGNLTDGELTRLAMLLNLQSDGHLLRQLRVAVELEQMRRNDGGHRGKLNRITKSRG